MPEKEVSNKALKRIEWIDTKWARKEYNSLSPDAKQFINDNVNNIFWLRNPERYKVKLDPSQPRDRSYVEKYNQILYSVIGETGKKYWERRVTEYKRHQKGAAEDAAKIVRELNAQQTPVTIQGEGILRGIE